ncbi:33241_t:CDS:2, partial [Racocetra persica]
FSLVNLSNVPSPVNDTLTNFPTFHPEFQKTWYSMISFTAFLQLVPGVFMLIWSLKYETLSVFIFNNEKTSTTTFNKLLAGYSIVTGTIAITLIILDLGKLFASIAVMHNYFEAIIIILLHQGGNLATNNNIIHYSIIYILIAGGATILLQWPYDAFWFKAQGLSLDWALLIQFIRLYLTTRRNYKKDDDDISLPLNTPGDEGESGHHNESNNSHLHHVLLLPLALLFHVAGNVLNSVFWTSGLAYGFAYTPLALYVYLDTHLRPNRPKKPIFIPDPSIPN